MIGNTSCACTNILTSTLDPQVLGGTLVFVGTRVPTQTLLDYLDDGCSSESFIENFLSVDSVDAADFLTLARETSAVSIGSRGGF